LHILLGTKCYGRNWWSSHRTRGLFDGNPSALAGMKVLFALRGISDISVHDPELEKLIIKSKESPDWPKFSVGTKQYCHVKLERILEHFNIALADAQVGKVNRKLLEDDEWHVKEVFPTIETEV